jgi:L-xylulokinase
VIRGSLNERRAPDGLWLTGDRPVDIFLHDHRGPVHLTARRRLLLGVDAGQTVTKAALYALDGTEVAVAGYATRVDSPQPRWAERSMDVAWKDVCAAISAVIERGGRGHDIVGVGVSGHNDGLYAVDRRGRPVRPAILALDSRARRQSARLGHGVSGARALALTGQKPSPASPASLLLWLREHEPLAYERTRWALFCKDWIRLCLTGQVATDVSDASAAFTDIDTQQWSAAALDLFDLADVTAKLPPILGSADVAGTVGARAAKLTGLAEGTPVVTGAHDVDAAAIGIGAATVGATSLVLGTYSINQVLSDRPVIDSRWQARAFVRPGRWLHMSTSPAGAVCLTWAVRLLGPWTASGGPDVEAAVAEAFTDFETRDAPLFLPFLYGSPHGPDVAGAWVGLQGRHARGDLLAAVVEGVAFNHRTHVDALREVFDFQRPVRLCGGGARSPEWTQLLADVLDIPVEVTDSDEAGARGAAMLTAVGTGQFADLDQVTDRWVRVVRSQGPRRLQARARDVRYQRYLTAVEVMRTLSPSADRSDDRGAEPSAPAAGSTAAGAPPHL